MRCTSSTSFSAVGVLKEALDEKAISILANKKMVNITVSEIGMTGELEKYFQHTLSIDQMKWPYKQAAFKNVPVS